VANLGSDNVSVLKNDGDGTFAPPVNYPAGDSPYSIFVANLDGDDDADLAVANYVSYTVSVLMNCLAGTDTDGDGVFDDGDGSGQIGDNPCTGGASTDCDDNCLSVVNPAQEDFDEDGIGDSCDICTDTDADGYGNPGFPANTCPEDNCPLVSNPGQENNDGDALGDVCDDDDDNDGVTDAADTSPLDPDVCADADVDGCDDCAVGVDDFGPLADNLPANDGTDTDADGLCDAGDPDDDNDGIDDELDNCQIVANPDQQDLDEDNIGDACDPCVCGLPGDVNGSGDAPTPLDVQFLVNKVYKGLDALYDFYGLHNCPYRNGDVNGDGGEPNPLDVTFLVMKVYKEQDALCPDRCAGCP
jgi:hypothetical protein